MYRKKNYMQDLHNLINMLGIIRCFRRYTENNTFKIHILIIFFLFLE